MSVTKKAGVSRMSFYRYYDILEDVITGYLEELFQECFDRIKKDSAVYNKEDLYLLFVYFRKNSQLIKNLIKSNLSHLILEICIDFFHMLSINITCGEIHSPTQQKYIIEFAAGGLYKVLIEWVKTGMKEKDMEMEEICCSLMK